MDATNHYTYNALSPGQHIRLLELNPGQHDDDLSGSLRPIDLAQKVLEAPYIAISYVWGSNVRCKEITIDNKTLRITASAEQVLCRVRVTDKPNNLWIDGICINQDDIDEREVQVTFMHHVYARAAATFVWLGLSADDSDIAMQYVGTLDWKIYDQEQRANHFNSHTILSKTFVLDIIPDDDSGKRLLIACGRLLARRWFSRVWIQQEIAVSISSVVACGRYEVSFDQIASLAWLFREKWSIPWPDWIDTKSFEMHGGIITRLQGMRKAHRRRGPGLPPDGFVDRSTLYGTLPQTEIEQAVLASAMTANQDAVQSPSLESLPVLLASTFAAEATDPRDKVYALLNMSANMPYNPKPDYRIDWQELYVKVARDILEFAPRSSLRDESTLLLWGGLANKDEEFHLPSWVPDWRINRGISLLQQPGWFPGGRGKPRFKSEQISKKQRLAILRYMKPKNEQSCFHHAARAWSMQTVAKLMDEIVATSDFGIDLDTDEPYSAYASRLAELDKNAMAIAKSCSEDYYLTGQMDEDAYAHVLIAGSGEQGEHVGHVSMLPALDSWRKWLENGCSGRRPEYMGYMERSWVFREYKVCTTKHGLMCLVPTVATKGNIVAVIQSVSMPVVLRPVLDRYYLMLGECYIHGLMENQVGVLIEEYNIKVKPDGTRTWRPEGDIRRNGLSTPAEVCHGAWIENDEHLKDISAAKYKALVDILGDQWVTLV